VTGPTGVERRLSASSWLLVAAAWLLVGIPLLWGILMTVKKALALFR
jgi:hypothetical protein